MTWFAFQGKNSGKAIDLAGAQEKIAVSWGFHGYGTQAQAEANPNSVNVVTGTEADLLIADYGAAVREKAQPGGPNANILNPATAAKASATGVASYAASAASSLIPQSVDGFFGALTQKNLWLRVAKVAIGGTLLIVGLAKLTGADKTVDVLGKAVAKAPLL